MVLTLLKISETRNVLNVTSTWYNIVKSYHGGGAWHNALFLTKASNVNCWADGANNVTPYHGLELYNTRIKLK